MDMGDGSRVFDEEGVSKRVKVSRVRISCWLLSWGCWEGAQRQKLHFGYGL